MAASNIRNVSSDGDFTTELANAGTKLVVADYFATWCGPCRGIAPAFADMSTRYPKAVFLKVDVDQCTGTAQDQGVSAMPTFIFYRNKVKLDLMRGADASQLEEKIKKWYSDEEGDDGDSPVKGHDKRNSKLKNKAKKSAGSSLDPLLVPNDMEKEPREDMMDLNTFISKAESECLNESDDHTFEHALSSKGGYLESDCDEQIIINLGFNQALKLHSMKINCTTANGPKNVKLFINQPNTLDFDSATSMEPVQMIELSKDDLNEGGVIPLKYVKLQNVMSLLIFIKDNQSGDETTRIDNLVLIGSPVGTTNMSEFKRVAGKKGESH